MTIKSAWQCIIISLIDLPLFKVLRRKGSFVRRPATDYSCVLIDHKEHIVSIYAVGNHLLQASFCKDFDAVRWSLVHGRNRVLGDIWNDQQPPLNLSPCHCHNISKKESAFYFESRFLIFSFPLFFIHLSKDDECVLRRLHLNVVMTMTLIGGGGPFLGNQWALTLSCQAL